MASGPALPREFPAQLTASSEPLPGPRRRPCFQNAMLSTFNAETQHVISSSDQLCFPPLQLDPSNTNRARRQTVLALIAG